jgi:hypothetical protein
VLLRTPKRRQRLSRARTPLQLEASRRSIAFAEASWCYPALGFRTPNESIGRWPGCCNETSPAAFRDALPIDPALLIG